MKISTVRSHVLRSHVLRSHVLRIAVLSTAAAFVTIPGSMLQAQTSPQPSTLYSADAVLTHSLNSSNAKTGQTVTAKLTGDVKTAGSMELPKGTLLIGKVDQVQHASSNGGSKISIVFDRAQIRKGQEVSIKATLLGAYPPLVYGADGSSGGAGSSMTAQPSTISNDHTVDQEPGALSNTSLTSVVESDASGVFANTNHSIKLESGTRLQVAVAPVHASGSNTTSSATAGALQ